MQKNLWQQISVCRLFRYIFRKPHRRYNFARFAFTSRVDMQVDWKFSSVYTQTFWTRRDKMLRRHSFVHFIAITINMRYVLRAQPAGPTSPQELKGLCLLWLMQYQRLREEKSLRHIAEVAKCLDDNKPIKSLKSLFALFQTSPILSNFL